MFLACTWLVTIRRDYKRSDPETKRRWLKTLTFKDWSCFSLVLLIILVVPVWASLQVSSSAGDDDTTLADTSFEEGFILGSFAVRGFMVVFRYYIN
jgi:hypothetical protein